MYLLPWRDVDFDYPRLQTLVQDHIEPEQLMHRVLSLQIRLDQHVHVRIAAYDRFHNQIDYILPHLFGVHAFFGQIGPQRFQRPLVTDAGVLVVVRLVVFVGLVDRVVGQVHELVADGFR